MILAESHAPRKLAPWHTAIPWNPWSYPPNRSSTGKINFQKSLQYKHTSWRNIPCIGNGKGDKVGTPKFGKEVSTGIKQISQQKYSTRELTQIEVLSSYTWSPAFANYTKICRCVDTLLVSLGSPWKGAIIGNYLLCIWARETESSQLMVHSPNATTARIGLQRWQQRVEPRISTPRMAETKWLEPSSLPSMVCII